jgi:predicted metal-binding membrane protein
VFVAAGLGVVVCLAWWQTVGDATRMSCMVDGFAQAGRAMPFDTGPARFVATWTVMMAAMMLPGIIGVVAAARVGRWSSGAARAFGLAFGYLAAWVPAAIPAFAVLTALNEVVQPRAGLDRVGGVVVALAGAYQFSGWKRRLLKSFDQAPGGAGGLREGLSHGLRCVGCSWALMSVLLVVGVMNLAWMAAIGAICFGEKVLSRRVALATAVGVALLGVGSVIVVQPQAMHAISFGV